jgi:hypothetical protein
MAETANTKIVTGLVRFSYLHVWEPSAIDEGDEKKYSASIIIPKSAPFIKDLEAKIEAATQVGIASKWGGKKPPKLKLPLRDGDIDRPEDPAYADCYFINATSKNKPGVLKRVGSENKDVVNEEELYSGCYGLATLNFYPFEFKGSKGVAAGLNSLFKIKDGEPLGGSRGNAHKDFAEVDVEQYLVESEEDLSYLD